MQNRIMKIFQKCARKRWKSRNATYKGDGAREKAKTKGKEKKTPERI